MANPAETISEELDETSFASLKFSENPAAMGLLDVYRLNPF
jgi:hypothetical protein